MQTDPNIDPRTLMPLYDQCTIDESKDPFELVLTTGTHQRITIDCLYGPTIFANLRITPLTPGCVWLIEREAIDTGQWAEVARIPGQYASEFK